MPKCDSLLDICEGVVFARGQKDIRLEELLYWELIDLMRSPETLKLVTGDMLTYVKEKSNWYNEQEEDYNHYQRKTGL